MITPLKFIRRLRCITVRVPRAWKRVHIDARPDAIAVDRVTVSVLGIEVSIHTTRRGHDGNATRCKRIQIVRT